MTPLSYYKILRSKVSATPKEIATTYRDLSILYRDRKEPISKEIMGFIDEAYYVLRDPGRRAKYDLENVVHPAKKVEISGLSEAEKVIYSWGQHFTRDEQQYLNKIHMINKVLQFIILGLAAVLIWSVVTFRLEVSFAIMFGVLFLRTMIWSIYKIKNPPPPIEVSAIE